MKLLGIIPARYESARLPGKALATIGDKPMVQHVYEQAIQSRLLDRVVVATDHNKIKKAMDAAGIPVVLTSPAHRSGTERCNEVLSSASPGFDYVINIQGDEPFIAPEQIDTLAGICDGHAEIATLVSALHEEEELHNPNVVKVVRDVHGKALYFSRSPIPYLRDDKGSAWATRHSYWKHIGMYAYRSDILAKISALSPGKLETCESLEQLRWLEHGYSIMTDQSDLPSIGVDTAEDLEKAREYWKKKQI